MILIISIIRIPRSTYQCHFITFLKLVSSMLWNIIFFVKLNMPSYYYMNWIIFLLLCEKMNGIKTFQIQMFSNIDEIGGNLLYHIKPRWKILSATNGIVFEIWYTDHVFPAIGYTRFAKLNKVKCIKCRSVINMIIWSLELDESIYLSHFFETIFQRKD